MNSFTPCFPHAFFLFIQQKPPRLPVTEAGAVIYFIEPYAFSASAPHTITCGGF